MSTILKGNILYSLSLFTKPKLFVMQKDIMLYNLLKKKGRNCYLKLKIPTTLPIPTIMKKNYSNLTVYPLRKKEYNKTTIKTTSPVKPVKRESKKNRTKKSDLRESKIKNRNYSMNHFINNSNYGNVSINSSNNNMSIANECSSTRISCILPQKKNIFEHYDSYDSSKGFVSLRSKNYCQGVKIVNNKRSLSIRYKNKFNTIDQTRPLFIKY